MIILTTFDLDEYVYAGLRAGASGFLLKDGQPAELLSAIRAVACGEAVVAPRVTRRLLSQLRPPAARPPAARPVDARLARLTDREREVLRQIARGSAISRSRLALPVRGDGQDPRRPGAVQAGAP